MTPLARLGSIGAPPWAITARGPAAEIIAIVWWVLLILGTAAFVIAMGFLLVASVRTTRSREPGNRFIIGWGVVFPGVLFAALMGLHVWSGTAVYAPPNPGANMSIEVVGYQFWWEFRYETEEGEAVTANEMHVPAGEPVELTLTTADVIHSFWIPQLHGKMDLIPGRDNTFWIQADEPGRFHGICAEYCGIQHARMNFVAVAEEPDDFARWLARQSTDAAEPETDRAQQGREVFAEVGCVSCHAVRGHFDPPPSPIGPDLTHLASRQSLAAAQIPNNRGNLGGWVLAPQDLKPGNRMPATDMTGSQLQALLDYLQGLE